jgi:CheY-like chemotaxis protein/signal transduction histidine kinase
LAVLSSYEVLDHPRDPIYADLAHLAATICGTAMGAITLLDHDRQWVLALTGGEPGETSRDVAFCAHTILNPLETLVVEDARLDPRFSDNPHVSTEPGIRFYAGAPVVSTEGHAVGAICVYATEVGHVSEMQREALAALARQVATQLELRRTLATMARQAEALQRARDEAEAANRARYTFLENIGHEIRTPMNGIVGLAEVLGTTSLTARQRQYVETISASSQGLMRVLGDALKYAESGIELSEVRRIPVDVSTVLGEVVSMVRPAALAKRLRLSLDIEPSLTEPIDTDPVRLRQIAGGLLGSAVRLAKLGGVDVRGRRDSRYLILDIQTTGAYAEVEDSLVQVRAIAQAMQGEIRCERAGAGCLITVRLALPFSVEEPRVLVAEDNEVNSLVLSAMLEDHGCHVVCVEDGAAAVAAMERERFDLVFMDIQMPVMDGVEATQTVRQRETDRRTPIVAVTASAIGDDQEAFREAGMDDLIEKPISERLVVDALRRWLPQQASA